VVLRIVFTAIVATVMELAVPQLAGGLALIVIAAKLLVPEGRDENGVKSASHLWAAVQIVVVADIVMSRDNVIAVAAAANGSVPLADLRTCEQIPLIVAGAALIWRCSIVCRCLLWAGAALLGWIAGDVIATDPAIHPKLQPICDGVRRGRTRRVTALLGVAPLFVGNGGEIVCATLGVVSC